MKCIETIYLSVLWNKSPLEKFLLARESIKGDPLSLYILVLCLEHLSQLIHREGKKKKSHLCFADDMLLFAEANEGQSQGCQKRIFDMAQKIQNKLGS